MYEASFGLKRRPFAATPDPQCFLTAGRIQEALDELVICVERGQGIAVLTAPAGTGKTLLCERLRCELDDRYETVFLRHASFLTRRALLQTVLCELNHQYHHPSEQELRLELFPAIRALQPKREALVLICDEAHQLTDSLLEELRILADFAEGGRPLVRLVLVGQLALEEKLAQPNLEAFNQRIRAHITLSTFDCAGSLDYIDYRVTWAGGRTDEVFTTAALDLIAHASDGVPRCINQLADHTLLLAFVTEQRPATEELVREALSDLRQLPLHWNEPSQSLSFTYPDQPINDAHLETLPSSFTHDLPGIPSASKPTMYAFEPEGCDDLENIRAAQTFDSSFTSENDTNDSLAASSEDTRKLHSAVENRVEFAGEDWQRAVELFTPLTSETLLVDVLSDLVPEPDNAAIDDNARVNLKRRIDFHNLLQQAYDVAGDSLNSTADTIPLADSMSESIEATPTDSGNAVIEHHSTPASKILDVESDQEPLSSHVIEPTSFTMQPPDAFQEEVVIDRYTTIDAGLRPPAISIPDTLTFAEVRVEQKPVTTFSHDMPNSAEADCAADVSQEATGHHELVSDQWKLKSRDVEARISIEESVAEEVYSLAESLRSNDSFRLPIESVLDDSRKEEEKISNLVAAEHYSQEADVPTSEAWESIETPSPPPVAESRPFRYLFSTLRRKQRGLS